MRGSPEPHKGVTTPKLSTQDKLRLASENSVIEMQAMSEAHLALGTEAGVGWGRGSCGAGFRELGAGFSLPLV